MKKLIFAAAICVLYAGAAAQSQLPMDEIRIAGTLDRIELPQQLRNMWQDEFDQVKGSYALSNGKTMQLSMWGNRMYAKIDGIPRAQLVAASPYTFVGLDRQMRIHITDVDSTGPINAEILLATPALAGAAPATTFTRLLASK